MSEPASVFVRPPWAQPWSIASVLVEGPTEEPLTLAEGKLRAGLDWPAADPRDALMLGFIKAARQKVEFDTGLALLTQTRDVMFAASASGVHPLPWQAMPVQSITVPEGAALDYFVQNLANRTVAWTTAIPAGAYRVVAGWPSPAALAAEAPLLLQAVGLLVGHFATAGRDVAIIGTIVNETPFGYEACIEPYRVVWLP